jgi:hypothetical protein
LQFGQPFDLMSISWAVSAWWGSNFGETGGRRHSGTSPGAPSTDTIGKLETFIVWLVKVSEPWLPCCCEIRPCTPFGLAGNGASKSALLPRFILIFLFARRLAVVSFFPAFGALPLFDFFVPRAISWPFLSLRRAAIAGELFACRRRYGLSYASQQRTSKYRGLEQARRKALLCDVKVASGFFI